MNSNGTIRIFRVVIERQGKEPLVAVFGGSFKRIPDEIEIVDFNFDAALFAPGG